MVRIGEVTAIPQKCESLGGHQVLPKDVVITRCVSRERLGDRKAFLHAAGEAFGMDFTEPSSLPDDNALRSSLLLSFHKWTHGKPGSDMSTTAARAKRQGRKRTRRIRNDAPPQAPGGDGTGGSSDSDDSDTEVSLGGFDGGWVGTGQEAPAAFSWDLLDESGSESTLSVASGGATLGTH